MSDLTQLFRDHLAKRQTDAEESLARTGFSALVISSGAPHTYFADDQDAPFRAVPHFTHWCPMAGPHHVVVARAGKKPLLVRYAPEDFWYEQAPLAEAWGGTPFWAEGFDLVEAGSLDAVWEAVGALPGGAYIGSETDRAEAAGLAANPGKLTKHLDWLRSTKTPYEIACLEEATRLGALGHKAAKEAFLAGASELEIHQAFVRAVGSVDADLPYGTIVGLNEKGAILHYEGKRPHVRKGATLLLDAGAKHLGYGSDITRTHAAPHCDERFAALIAGMEKLQLGLCATVKPGLHYGAFHQNAHQRVAELLKENGILKGSAEEAVDKGWSRAFFPHGLGHHLGIQVHDVAGKQVGPDGEYAAPPPEHPFLRTTRIIEEGQVFTVEPGLYFIPMLLKPLRANGAAAAFDWKLIDELTPFGGIRIEDNLVVTATGSRNLTRERLPH
ncbi:MAG TPA: Xaa-Pro dipeptidase [Holophagaceae bacterium]|nr:Xaa-Pro dipeptidase [Holophagaceae bacterium]